MEQHKEEVMNNKISKDFMDTNIGDNNTELIHGGWYCDKCYEIWLERSDDGKCWQDCGGILKEYLRRRK